MFLTTVPALASGGSRPSFLQNARAAQCLMRSSKLAPSSFQQQDCKRPGAARFCYVIIWGEAGAADLSHCSNWSWFTKPACCTTRRPPKRITKLGMPRTLKHAAS